MGVTWVHLSLEIAIKENITWVQIWWTKWPPNVTMEGHNMTSKHFSQNAKRTTSCVYCYMILLKSYILLFILIQNNFNPFRPERIFNHFIIVIRGNCWSSAVFYKEVQTSYAEQKNNTPHCKIRTVE